jgi:hypothetical protein
MPSQVPKLTRSVGPAEIMASPSVATMHGHLFARAHDLAFGGDELDRAVVVQG